MCVCVCCMPPLGQLRMSFGLLAVSAGAASIVVRTYFCSLQNLSCPQLICMHMHVCIPTAYDSRWTANLVTAPDPSITGNVTIGSHEASQASAIHVLGAATVSHGHKNTLSTMTAYCHAVLAAYQCAKTSLDSWFCSWILCLAAIQALHWQDTPLSS